MAHDLRTTISPVYPSLLQQLLALLPRTISALALTSPLETLSSFFRYLLIPAVNPNLLEETWNMVLSVLPKCLGEIQRAMTEVWGGVLRKLKPGPREEAKKEYRDAERVHGSLSSRARYLDHSTSLCPSFDEIAQSVSQTLHVYIGHLWTLTPLTRKQHIRCFDDP